MGLYAYISFNGNCEEAMNFYRDALEADELQIMYWKDAPEGAGEQGNPDPNQIMHGELIVGDGRIMAADSPPDFYQKPQGVSISHVLDDVGQAEKVFHALSDGAQIMMPFGETFFSPGFGMLLDKFGISWMIMTNDAS